MAFLAAFEDTLKKKRNRQICLRAIKAEKE